MVAAGCLPCSSRARRSCYRQQQQFAGRLTRRVREVGGELHRWIPVAPLVRTDHDRHMCTLPGRPVAPARRCLPALPRSEAGERAQRPGGCVRPGEPIGPVGGRGAGRHRRGARGARGRRTRELSAGTGQALEWVAIPRSGCIRRAGDRQGGASTGDGDPHDRPKATARRRGPPRAEVMPHIGPLPSPARSRHHARPDGQTHRVDRVTSSSRTALVVLQWCVLSLELSVHWGEGSDRRSRAPRGVSPAAPASTDGRRAANQR